MENARVLSAAAEPGWKNYDDFAAGIDTNRLPSTHHWRGKTLNLHFDDEQRLQLFFATDESDTLRWRWGLRQGEAPVNEVRLSSDRYFFSFPLNASIDECMVLVVNTHTQRALMVHCTLLAEAQTQGGSRLSQDFHPGTLAQKTPHGMVPHLTRELIGYRTLNIYSPNHYYEHFYVNSQRYAWQNLRGEQFGHGDMDYATYYKFEPEMYLFTFREKIIPVCSVFFFDFNRGRCTGIFMGVNASGAVEIRPAGALIKKMSFNCYPQDVHPL